MEEFPTPESRGLLDRPLLRTRFIGSGVGAALTAVLTDNAGQVRPEYRTHEFITGGRTRRASSNRRRLEIVGKRCFTRFVACPSQKSLRGKIYALVNRPRSVRKWCSIFSSRGDKAGQNRRNDSSYAYRKNFILLPFGKFSLEFFLLCSRPGWSK